jgi:hypothetical protein
MWSRLDGLAWSFWDFKGHTLLCCRATHKERVGHAFLSSMELDGTGGTIGCVRTESLVFGVFRGHAPLRQRAPVSEAHKMC